MKTTTNISMKRRFLLFLFGALIPLLGQRMEAQAVVIANPGIKATEVSAADLHDIFTGRVTTLKGAQVAPVLLKDGAAHTSMLALYIWKSDTAFRASWRNLIFCGQGSMPKIFDSEAAVVDYVAHTPGAIGYIGKATPHEGVKTLAVK